VVMLSTSLRRDAVPLGSSDAAFTALRNRWTGRRRGVEVKKASEADRRI
jgi:hypothetical protein